MASRRASQPRNGRTGDHASGRTGDHGNGAARASAVPAGATPCGDGTARGERASAPKASAPSKASTPSRVSAAPRVSAARPIERALMDDIAAGLVEPGAHLDETRLAERFGTSRTPVREALSRLVAGGIATSGAGRGVRVARYGREELAEMFEAMQELEVICAGLAARRLTLLARAELEDAQRACRAAAEAGDRAAYLRANEAFHEAIYAATRNRYIAGMAGEFRRRTGPFRARKFTTHEDLIASADGHDELLATILSSDDGTACEGMRVHMQRSYLDTLAAQGAEAAEGAEVAGAG